MREAMSSNPLGAGTLPPKDRFLDLDGVIKAVSPSEVAICEESVRSVLDLPGMVQRMPGQPSRPVPGRPALFGNLEFARRIANEVDDLLPHCLDRLPVIPSGRRNSDA